MTEFATFLSQLRAAGEETRLRTLLLLREGELSVGDLTELLDQSQPRVSRHLKVLAEAALVERFQEGTFAFYRLSPVGRAAVLSLITAPDLRLPEEDLVALRALRVARAEAVAAYFSSHAAEWDDVRRRYIDEAEIERAMLELAGEEIGTFVDLGCGTGQMLLRFADRYEHGIGIDTSPEMLAIARARLLDAGLGQAQARRGDILDEGVPGRADVICLHHVLHFLSAPERAIAAAAKALSADGRLLIADFASHDHEDLRALHAHARLGFSEEEVAGWGAANGLAVEAVRKLDPPSEDGIATYIWCLTPACAPVSHPHLSPEGAAR